MEEFTAARDALAKQLRAAGDADAASAVKALKKPSRAAWEVNRISREAPAAVDELLLAGAAVRKAQEAALRGDASPMRDANRRLAAALDDLSQWLGPVTSAVRDAAVATWRAAATDDAVSDALKRGILVKETEASGFGLEGFDIALVPTRGGNQAGDDRAGAAAVPRRPDPRLIAEAERAQARATRLLQAAATAEARAAEARVAADEAVAVADAAKAAIDL